MHTKHQQGSAGHLVSRNIQFSISRSISDFHGQLRMCQNPCHITPKVVIHQKKKNRALTITLTHLFEPECTQESYKMVASLRLEGVCLNLILIVFSLKSYRTLNSSHCTSQCL